MNSFFASFHLAEKCLEGDCLGLTTQSSCSFKVKQFRNLQILSYPLI